MGIVFRKLMQDDLDVFIEMRINQLREEGVESNLDLKPHLYGYYIRYLEDGTFISWLAIDDRKIVGTSGMSFVEKPPYYSNPHGKIGLLSSMYTLKEYRRKGIAKELLDRVVNEAKDYGFKKNENFMQYIF